MGIDGREYQLATQDLTFIGPTGTWTWSTQRDVKYKTATNKEAVKDKRGRNIGWTSKDEDNGGASMRVLLSEWVAFKAWAAGQFPGIPILRCAFGAAITYGENPIDFTTDKWEGAMFQEDPRAATSDQKELEVELPLFILHVLPGGVPAF